jgi:hypothetical protein
MSSTCRKLETARAVVATKVVVRSAYKERVTSQALHSRSPLGTVQFPACHTFPGIDAGHRTLYKRQDRITMKNTSFHRLLHIMKNALSWDADFVMIDHDNLFTPYMLRFCTYI